MADQKLPYNTLIHMLNIKLSSSNFMLWKTQVQHILRAQKFFGYLDGSHPCPPAPVLPPAAPDPAAPAAVAAKAVYKDALTAYDDWMAEDQRLCGLLFSSLSEEAMSEVIGCSTSNQIWETLSSIYQNRSRSSILQLRDQVLNLRHTSTVHDLHLKFKAIFDRLSSMGSAASNDDQVLWFLRALGSNFKEFSAPIMNQSPSPSYINVVAQAENHEAFLNSLSGHGSSGPLVPTPTAFAALDRSSFDDGNRWSSPGCGDSFSTGRTGGRSGRSSGRCNGRSQGRRRDLPQCQWCGKTGHVASSCFKLTSPPSRQQASANLAAAF
ncbi:hypothetical protein QQ045_028912 [Rhodiola kirilowii]